MKFNRNVTRHSFQKNNPSITEAEANKSFYERIKSNSNIVNESVVNTNKEINQNINKVNSREVNEIARIKKLDSIYESVREYQFINIMTEAYKQCLFIDEYMIEQNDGPLRARMENFINSKGGIKYLEECVRKENSNFLSSVLEACNKTAKKVKNKKAAIEDVKTIDFTPEEDIDKEETKKDIAKLSVDKLSELVKDKVLTVVQEEKERAKKKKEFEEEIEMKSEEAMESLRRFEFNKKTIGEETTIFDAFMRESCKELLNEGLVTHMNLVGGNYVEDVIDEEDMIEDESKGPQTISDMEKCKDGNCEDSSVTKTEDDEFGEHNKAYISDEVSDDIDMFVLTNESCKNKSEACIKEDDCECDDEEHKQHFITKDDIKKCVKDDEDCDDAEDVLENTLNDCDFITKARVTSLVTENTIESLIDRKTNIKKREVYLEGKMKELAIDKENKLETSNGFPKDSEIDTIMKKITANRNELKNVKIALNVKSVMESCGKKEACCKENFRKKDRYCDNCGTILGADATKCPECGNKYEFDDTKNITEESWKRKRAFRYQNKITKNAKEVKMEHVMCDAIAKYTLMEMVYTCKLDKYDSQQLREKASKIIAKK